MISRGVRQFIRRGRKHELTWRYIFNFSPSVAYRMGGHRLTGEADRVLRSLNEDGIAVSSVEALLGATPLFDELQQARLELQRRLAPEIASARFAANSPGSIGDKSFMLELLGNHPEFDPDSIYARFSLQRPVLEIANAYYGMMTRLRYYNVWHTFASNLEARESQLWHRDREDYLILKMFVYLVDVDEGAGPFTYARGTHLKGRLAGAQPEHFMEGCVQRTTDEQMEKVVPRERWLPAVGKIGSIVFADTHGYHKGGFARTSDRIMFKCMFTSQASESHEFMRRTKPVVLPADRERAFALSGPVSSPSR